MLRSRGWPARGARRPVQTHAFPTKLHYFATQHGKGLDKQTVSFQILLSKRREGVPGKLFAGERKLTISVTFQVAGTTWQISKAAD